MERTGDLPVSEPWKTFASCEYYILRLSGLLDVHL